MNVRIAALAGIAIAITVAACGGGPSAELRAYVEDMNQWLEVNRGTMDSDPLRWVEREALLEQLDAFDPPSEMLSAHNVLMTAYGSLLVADREASNRDSGGRVPGRTSQTIAAFDAYLAAEINWGFSLGNACGLDIFSALLDSGPSACLEK